MAPDGRRQGRHKAASVKWTVEPHFQQADFLALAIQVLDRFLGGFAARAHQHHHALGIGRADIIKKAVFTTGQSGKFVHDLLHVIRAGGIEVVGGFPALEIDIRILRRSAQHRLVGRHAPGRDVRQ
jgi:hypothetical protein